MQRPQAQRPVGVDHSVDGADSASVTPLGCPVVSAAASAPDPLARAQPPAGRWYGNLSLRPLIEAAQFTRGMIRYVRAKQRAAGGVGAFRAHPGVRSILLTDHTAARFFFEAPASVLDREGRHRFGALALRRVAPVANCRPALTARGSTHVDARRFTDALLRMRDREFEPAITGAIDRAFAISHALGRERLDAIVLRAAGNAMHGWIFGCDAPEPALLWQWLESRFTLEFDTVLGAGVAGLLLPRYPQSMHDLGEAMRAHVLASPHYGAYTDLAEQNDIPTTELADLLMFTVTVNGVGAPVTTLVPALCALSLTDDFRHRLAAELEGFDGSLTALDQLPLLDAFMWESLRLNPRPRQYYREAQRPLAIPTACGTLVRAETGDLIGLVLPLAHRDPAVFSDADRFDPDRFIRDPELRHQVFPFGPAANHANAYGCAGQQVLGHAGKLWKAIACQFARDCDWQLSPAATLDPDLPLGIAPADLTVEWPNLGRRPVSSGPDPRDDAVPLDLHTGIVRRVIGAAMRRYQPTPTHAIPLPSGTRPTVPVAHVNLAGHRLTLPADDDNVPVRPAWLRRLLAANNRFSPMRDNAQPWASREACADALHATFGKLLPKPHVAWSGAHEDSGFDLFVRHGIAAHRLERATRAEAGSFVLRMENLADLPVRDGFERYGGDAFLDADGRAVRIRLHGVDIHPGEPRWAAAGFVFRASCLVHVTVADHLFGSHYGYGNALVLATRRHLAHDHPLRRLLTPFCFRTAAINDGSARTLTPHGALIHRATALTWAGLEALYGRTLDCDLRPDFGRRLTDTGMHPRDMDAAEQRLFPLQVDGVEYADCVDEFVTEALASSPALAAVDSPRWRAETNAWLKEVAAHLNPANRGGQPADLDHCLRLLLFEVTAMHSHVGHVAPFVLDPAMGAGRAWPGRTMADRQNTLQLCTIAALTGLEVPGVVGDFYAHMPDRETRSAAEHFQESLRALQTRIEQRNESLEQPFVNFSPRVLPVSVSR